jgi:DnaK suppressor protein
MYVHQHLTRAQLRDLRIELEQELAWLDRALARDEERALAALGTSDEDDPTGHGGLAVALDGRTRTRRAHVADALHRMMNDEYGSCIRCGADIPYGRLVVLPEAAHCLGCGTQS